MYSERTRGHGHPPQTLLSRGPQFPHGDKLSAVSSDPESEAVRNKGPGPETCKELWEMDSRREVFEEATKGFTERVHVSQALQMGRS